jgi:uncharacterized protein
MFFMGGALMVTLVTFRFILKMKQPLFGDVFHLPTKADIDPNLIAGAALFGTGWGLVGYCPGPAIAAIAYLDQDIMIFLAAMFMGAFGGQLFLKRA